MNRTRKQYRKRSKGQVCESIRSLASILFIKSELPCRVLCTFGVILNFIKPLPDITLVVRHLSWKRKNLLHHSLQSFKTDAFEILSHLIKFPYDKIFQKLFYLTKTTLFKISPIETSLDFALELEAGLDECPEYVLVSITAWPKTSKIHLETDCVVTVLNGFMKLNNS